MISCEDINWIILDKIRKLKNNGRQGGRRRRERERERSEKERRIETE